MKYIGIAVAVIVVLAAGYYLFRGVPAGAPTATTEGTKTDAAGSPQSGSSTFAELAARGGSLQCMVTTTQGGATTHGTVYLANGQMRGDFTSSVSGLTINSSVIQTGGFIYSWSDASPQGVKIPVTASASTSASTRGFNPNAQVSYTCSPWTPDSGQIYPSRSYYLRSALDLLIHKNPPAWRVFVNDFRVSYYPSGGIQTTLPRSPSPWGVPGSCLRSSLRCLKQ